MTVRALLLGMLGAVCIASLGYINSMVLGLNRLVGSFVPVSVFGALLILVMGLNPLLLWVRKGVRFRAGEIAVMTTPATGQSHSPITMACGGAG